MHLNIAAVTPERYQQLTVVRLTRSMTSGYQRGCHALELHSSVLGGITGRAIDGLASIRALQWWWVTSGTGKMISLDGDLDEDRRADAKVESTEDIGRR
jgi:hypothetical protein